MRTVLADNWRPAAFLISWRPRRGHLWQLLPTSTYNICPCPFVQTDLLPAIYDEVLMRPHLSPSLPSPGAPRNDRVCVSACARDILGSGRERRGPKAPSCQQVFPILIYYVHVLSLLYSEGNRRISQFCVTLAYDISWLSCPRILFHFPSDRGIGFLAAEPELIPSRASNRIALFCQSTRRRGRGRSIGRSVPPPVAIDRAAAKSGHSSSAAGDAHTLIKLDIRRHHASTHMHPISCQNLAVYVIRGLFSDASVRPSAAEPHCRRVRERERPSSTLLFLQLPAALWSASRALTAGQISGGQK